MAFDVRKVDVLDMLEKLEIRNIIESGPEIQFSCPSDAHAHGDEKPSAYMNRETTKYFCHGCKERGDAVSFVANYMRVSPIKAIRFLRQAYDPAAYDPDQHSMVDELKMLLVPKGEPDDAYIVHLDESILSGYVVDWDRAWEAVRDNDAPLWASYIINRGFDPITLNKWEFGYDPISDRVCFTVRDHEGKLVGLKGRAYEKDRQPKYQVLGDREGKPKRYGFPTYPTARVVFGLHRAIEDYPQPIRTLIICEGELNAVALWQHKFAGAVALNGSNVSDYQLALLKEHADRVIIFFDSDVAGHQGMLTLAQRLQPFIKVLTVPEHDGDPADMSPQDIEDCIEEATSVALLNMVGS